MTLKYTLIYSHRMIFLNGPPGCGKDTAARVIIEQINNDAMLRQLNPIEVKFSWPLKSALQHFFSLTDAEVKLFEQDKEKPRQALLGKSWRQAQISLSEGWAKPWYDDPEIFGKLFWERMRRQGTSSLLWICSDSGFKDEATAVINNIGTKNCLLLRIHRAGCDFANDSRGYIELPVRSIDVRNPWTPQLQDKEMARSLFSHKLMSEVSLWLNL